MTAIATAPAKDETAIAAIGDNQFGSQAFEITSNVATATGDADDWLSAHVLDWTIANRNVTRVSLMAQIYFDAADAVRNKKKGNAKGRDVTRDKATANLLKPLVTRICPNVFGFEWNKEGQRIESHVERFTYEMVGTDVSFSRIEKGDESDVETRLAVLSGYQNADSTFTDRVAKEVVGDSVVYTGVSTFKPEGYERAIAEYFKALDNLDKFEGTDDERAILEDIRDMKEQEAVAACEAHHKTTVSTDGAESVPVASKVQREDATF